jgi:acetyl esterase
MVDRSRWDPDMAAFTAAGEAEAKNYPPIRLEIPLEPHRRVNDALSMRTASGGPEMAETAERWVAARGRKIYCRVYRPVTDRPLPVLVWFHGGGWVWASVDTHDRLCREYAAAAGVAVVSVDYALSPEAKFPQAVEECAAVVRHLAEHGAAWGLDGSRILLGGDSAGGNLCLATALLLRDSGGPSLRGLVCYYPVCDSRFDTPSYLEFGAGGYGLNRERMAFYWSVYASHEGDRSHPLAAPLRADLRGLPPTLVVHLAELDVLRSEGEALIDKLRAAQVPVEAETFPGVLHGFVRATEAVAKSRDAMAKASSWIRRVA